jgi:multiple sugar transport system substrate-binding protein
MRIRAAALVTALAMAPLGARGADLVVWWDEGYYAEEHEAVREIVAVFEQDTGKQVELVFHPEGEHPEAIVAALEAGAPPDFAFGFRVGNHITEWAFDDRLVDLSGAVRHFSDLFDPDALAWMMLLNERTGQKALYALPVGRSSYHIHVWKSLLEQAGFTLEDIPSAWEAFWAFWCDQVQPAVRRTTGRDDLWGVGLPMSADAEDTRQHIVQFMIAYEADWVTPDGRLVIDDPEVRQRLVKALDSHTAIYRKGCTPPDSVTWANSDNNKQFHAQAVVMTPNNTLSIVNALKHERPENYYENTATVEWRSVRTARLSPSRQFLRCRGVQGWRSGRHCQGVRALPRERGMADALSQLLCRPPAAGHAEAARCAILARPERPAPHGRGDAGRVAPDAIRLRYGFG